MKIIGCIPARLNAVRLPRKPLLEIHGKPLVLHVAEAASMAKRLDHVVVVTDSEEIATIVNKAGFCAAMTSSDCQNGTERIIDYAKIHDADVFVNIQGDEFGLQAKHIDFLIEQFTQDANAQMGTLAQALTDPIRMQDPAVVKVVTDLDQNALYFSRHCIPIQPNLELPDSVLQHIGIYIYSRDLLRQLATWQPTTLELIERLEQLRVLQHGVKIKVVEVSGHRSIEVNTPADLARARAQRV